MAITPLPPAPLPSDSPTTFNSKAFDLVAALAGFVTETNAVASAVDVDAAAADADAATATTQAGIATTQAGIATTKAAEAAVSAAAAAAFGDLYLGAKASDPTVDNDGGPLQAGMLYFNTTFVQMKVRSSSAWEVAYLPASAYVQGPASVTDGNFAAFSGTTGKVIAQATNATQAEMEAGTQTALRAMSPLRVKQAITALAPLPPKPTLQKFEFIAATGTWSRAASKTGTYVRTVTTGLVTVTTAVAHGLTTGDRIWSDYTSGTAIDEWATITVTGSTTFTYTSGATTATSGNITVYPPILITITGGHFLSNGVSTYIDFNATITDAISTVYNSTSTTFNAQVGAGTEGAGSSGTVTLTVSGKLQTYTKPTGCRAILVELCGGGGASVTVCCTGSSYGSAGGYSKKLIDATSITTVEVKVGGRGYVGSSYSATISGQTTSFGAYLSATGAATGASTQTPGAGSNGDLNKNGGTATQGAGTWAAAQGGSNPLGTGMIVGGSGSGYGYGSTPGQAAGNGVVYVWEYY